MTNFNVRCVEGDTCENFRALKHLMETWLSQTQVLPKTPIVPVTVGDLLNNMRDNGYPVNIDMYKDILDCEITDMRFQPPDVVADQVTTEVTIEFSPTPYIGKVIDDFAAQFKKNHSDETE
jgi:hypothetical protein